MTNKKEPGKRTNETEIFGKAFFNKDSTTSIYSSNSSKGIDNEFQNDLSVDLAQKIIQISATEASRKVDELFRKEQSQINERNRKSNEVLALASELLEKVQASHDRVSIVVNDNRIQLESAQKIAEKAEHEVSTIKAQTVSAMALFVSFFAFITISINIFSKASSVFSAACLLVIFWMLLIGFNIMIGWQLKSLQPTKTHMTKLAAVVVLSFVTIVILYLYDLGFYAIKSPLSSIA